MRRDWGPNSNAPCWSQPDYIDFWIAWTEELFRDEKSSGFRWGKSHVTDPAHAARLVLLMALATYLALSLGSRVIQAGLRKWLEPTRQRTLSLFQIGLRWIMFCLTHERALPKDLSPVPS